ncbi:hypothetical protein ACFYOV_12350 [Streptomyces sp. NPDC005931]|uniref:hypothetical protein n=1 Tax=Streptomyces sp. NPDC005931 TaxID=3364737 RepID=UPI003685BF50
MTDSAIRENPCGENTTFRNNRLVNSTQSICRRSTTAGAREPSCGGRRLVAERPAARGVRGEPCSGTGRARAWAFDRVRTRRGDDALPPP